MSSRFVILKPCPRRWSELTGGGRTRYCGDCGKSVHALEEYPAEEREKLWVESRGRICAMMAAPPPEPQRSRRAMLAGALLSAISPLMAQTGTVRIRVTDSTGAAIPKARVSVLEEHDKPGQELLTDGAGEVVWKNLRRGNAKFRISQTGFASLKMTVTVRGSGEVKIEAPLQLGMLLGEVVEVMPHPSPAGAAPQPKRRWWWIF